MNKKVLLIPDAYFGDFSGSYVTQIVKQLLLELGFTVAIFSDEVDNNSIEKDGTLIFARPKYKMMANWLEFSYASNYISVLNQFDPGYVFTLGSVTNKNICYWKIAKGKGIKVISMIFMQDFFCAKYYANDYHGLCTKCLDSGFRQAIYNGCTKTQRNSLSYLLKGYNAAFIRYRLQKELCKADAVITSSQQQIEFYVKYGIPREKCFKTPLYFNGNKLLKYKSIRGNYYVFIAQNRIDKGIHLLQDILSNCNPNVKVIAAYSNQQKIDEALLKYGLKPFVEKGILEMKPNCTWNTDLGEIVASSRGVLNPSIWPSTTEYVLLETLGLRKPIFVYDVGIHSEIIQSGVNGFIASDSLTMAKQMNDFIQDDLLYEKVSEGAFLLYQKLTDWEGWKNTLDIILNK